MINKFAMRVGTVYAIIYIQIMKRPELKSSNEDNKMRQIKLHTNQEGSGRTVICLHGSASSSGQWKALMEKLSNRYHVIAPDLYGYGKSPVWNGGAEICLEDEAALLEPLMQLSTEPVHLIGHSFGAALALKAALKYPDRVMSVAVYEPVLFKLIFDDNSASKPAAEIRQIRDTVYRGLNDRQPHEAARVFVDYWNGSGTWEKLDPRRHSLIAGSMRSVLMNFNSLFSDGTVLDDFRKLNVPVLYLHGLETPDPTRHITDLLTSVLSHLEFCVLPGMGHMGPLTHAENVNEIINGFLKKQDAKIGSVNEVRGTNAKYLVDYIVQDSISDLSMKVSR
jgi:pimeloyl-ACP methyl ester carboxylesterase